MRISIVSRDDLISKEYRKEQERLHADPRGYGGKGYGWAETVDQIARWYKCKSILDYGCGQGTLGKALRERGRKCGDYDPAVKTFRADPAPADLVVCTDVLEHAEGDKIDCVLGHLYMLTKVRLFTVISTVETAKTLSDGRQAHISLHSFDWWAQRFAKARLTLDASADIENPKPEKQIVALWRPWEGAD